ncbi:MAG: FAD dependent oxidoreductase [Planctomycetes bacterium ADurb.Bin401]|nr:MAG: FAD dependent oxidoreductase [Planctomycetes bacterium ADurb.Bin401]
MPREDILFFKTLREKEIAVNCTRIINVLGTDVWDWTFAEWQGHKQIRQISYFLKKYVPGFEKSYVVQSGVHAGVRESRRIVGEYKLTADDILSVRKFDDMIACGSYPIDIHNPKGQGTTLMHLPENQWYTIPLRCLIPQKIDHVLVAGRCISGTHEAHSSYRVMPISFATGQAAGVCAALSVHTGKLVRNIPAIDVQQELLKQEAILDK